MIFEANKKHTWNLGDIILKSKEIDFYQAFEEIVGVSIEEYQEVNLIEYINMMRNISKI